MDTSFTNFLNTFIPQAADARLKLAEAQWQLETLGTSDSADLTAKLALEEQALYTNDHTYQKLLEWNEGKSIEDPLLKRQLDLLIRAFKFNQVSIDLLKQISNREIALSQSYVNFKAITDGRHVSENDILEILKNENDLIKREKAWAASKQIGDIWAPQILDLVTLRNQQARELGYRDFFHMQLDRAEVNESWLFELLEELISKSEDAYLAIIHEIEEWQMKRFAVPKEELGPWAWSDPFGQHDPMDDGTLDDLVKEVDILSVCQGFFKKLGFEVEGVLKRSDLFERPNKNQHAFCINIDKEEDVRILANILPTLYWLDGLLHELGHAVYELNFDKKLPWLLREYPNAIVTEAIALLFNRQAYCYDGLCQMIGVNTNKQSLMKKAQASLNRRQLILSRFVMVLTFFERELYRNPNQDLNSIWWHLVEKLQQIRPPKGNICKNAWAAKYHIGLVPVYSFSYLIGELLASTIEESILAAIGKDNFYSPNTGKWLVEKIFYHGSRLQWNQLIQHATGEDINAAAWTRQFCSKVAES